MGMISMDSIRLIPTYSILPLTRFAAVASFAYWLSPQSLSTSELPSCCSQVVAEMQVLLICSAEVATEELLHLKNSTSFA